MLSNDSIRRTEMMKEEQWSNIPDSFKLKYIYFKCLTVVVFHNDSPAEKIWVRNMAIKSFSEKHHDES